MLISSEDRAVQIALRQADIDVMEKALAVLEKALDVLEKAREQRPALTIHLDNMRNAGKMAIVNGDVGKGVRL